MLPINQGNNGQPPLIKHMSTPSKETASLIGTKSASSSNSNNNTAASSSSVIGNTPRQRAVFVQCVSVPTLVACALWLWWDASNLPHVPGMKSNIDLDRQRSASQTLGWMFLCEAFGQLGLIFASHRHVVSEEVGRGNLALSVERLPSSTHDLVGQGADIHVDFHHWMKSEDDIKRWSSFVSYLCFIVLVSFCRFDLAGQAFDADMVGSHHSTTLQLCVTCLFGPQLVSASCYVFTGKWPCQWYGALIFLLCPFVTGLSMFIRFSNGVDRQTDNAFWGGVVLLMYMAPFMVYTLGEPHVQRWHMEIMSLAVWCMLAVAGRGMMR